LEEWRLTQASSPNTADSESSWSFTPPFSARLTTFMSDGWGSSQPPAADVSPPAELLESRRDRLRTELDRTAPALITAGTAQIRNGDQSFAFRADSDYVWLTGDQQAGGVLILDPSAASADRLYIDAPLPRSDPRFYTDANSSEVWVGTRPTPAQTSQRLGIDVRPLSELPQVLATLVSATVSGGQDPVIAGVTRQPARDGIALKSLISELRMIKDAWEIAELRRAVDLTIDSFNAIRPLLKPGATDSEREIEAAFIAASRRHGNGTGFAPIVGAGSHATTLHWTRNDGPVRAGDLVLIDAGTETDSLYTGDLTRTFPAGGRFTDLQRRVYEHVLAAEDAAFAALRPGAEYQAYYPAVERRLVEGLAELGVLPVSVDESLDPGSGLHRRWTLCAPGHHMGLDVHDCGAARDEAYLHGPLRPGMVLTIEPGLYFQQNDELVPRELRGTGIRIEDDVLITEDGYEVLSRRLPRLADDVEAWISA
jgi:Xaa-Pro aminopeptidase